MATRNPTKPGDDRQVLIPAVAYVRCSTDQQIDASIPAQKASIEKWATDNGYAIQRWYVDEGISGWKEDREQFQQLITDLEKRHDFQAVLCWHTNRFSRFPVLEANHYWYLLDRAGVHLATVLQGRQDWADIGSWLKASIEQHGDAQHRIKLSADVKRGKRTKAQRGEWQGRIPFGYVVADGRLQLGDPLHIEIVRRIIREYLEGRSIRGIAAGLNADGYGTLAGNSKGWSISAVHSKLTNITYTGLYRWQEVEIPGNHPAIITPADFAQVQLYLDERKRRTTPHLNGGIFLFTGLVRCGKCDSAMTGSLDRQNIYYRCANSKMKGLCTPNSFRQDEMLACVVDTIEAYWMDSETVKRLRQALRDLMEAEHPKVNAKQIESQLAALDARLAKAKRRLVEVDTDMLALVQEQIRALQGQHEQLATALRAASTPRSALYDDADRRIQTALELFSHLRGVLESADPVHQREVMRQTVSRIESWSERTPPKNHYRLDHGNIDLRTNNLFGSS
jgi:site-specific DNA recombinase